MWSVIISLVIGLILFVVLLIAANTLYLCREHGSLQKLGFVGPEYKRMGGTMVSGDPKKTIFTTLIEQYQQFKHHKVFATYSGPYPTLIVADLDIAKDVLGKYANNFNSRRSYTKVAAPPESSLVSMDGEQWKRVRRNTSLLFSTANLKRTSNLFDKKAKDFVAVLQTKQESGEPVELKNLFSAFLLDAMTNSVFSLDIDSFKDPSNKIYQNAKLAADAFLKAIFACFMFPWLTTVIPFLRSLGMDKVLDFKGIGSFFQNMYDRAVEERQSNREGGKHNDFLQVLLDQEKQKHLDTDGLGDDDVKLHSKSRKKETLNDKEKWGAILAVMLGGFDNGSTSVALILFVIANNPSVLKKVQEEIDEKLKGEFPSYDNTLSLTYLEMCIHEAERLYPIGVIFERVCVETCHIQGITFPKDVGVAIPAYAIHYDANIWPEPEKFDPERFSPENRADRHPCAFIPFGAGPRNCVGIRLAQLQIRLALATVLQNFTPAPCEKTVYPIVEEKFKLLPADGLWLKFERRQKSVS